MKKPIIAVAGPTASGKTALAVALAGAFGGEVISNDSMQVYRGMEIGTAAPTPDEMKGIPHHLIGILEPDRDFSCAEYAVLAKEKIADLEKRKKIPVFCGGTGLYLDSVFQVSGFSEGEKNEEIRRRLSDFAEKNGVDALHSRLCEIDPESADAIHKNNVRRVIRAIEIFETTGVKKSEWDRRSREFESPYALKRIVLDFLNREVLNERIRKRVDIMFDMGLESEVRSLWEGGLLTADYPAFQAIGYKEFVPYFKGEASIGSVRDAIKLATTQYAKRQVTWFKRYRDALVIHPDRENGEMKPFSDIADEAINQIKVQES